MAYGAWAVSLPPFSGTATTAVVAAGVVAMVVGAARSNRAPSRPVEPPAPAAVAPWAVLAAGLAAWQLAAYLQSPRRDHPTLSSLANALLDSHPARTLAFVLWLAAAWALARR